MQAANILDWIWNHIESLFDVPGQAVWLSLLMVVFVWTILRIRKDPYLFSQVRNWLSVSIGAVIIVTTLLYISPLVLPAEDQFALYRVLVLRLASFLTGLVVLTGGILFVASVLPTGTMRRIEDAPYGPTIIIATIIASLAYLITYS